VTYRNKIWLSGSIAVAIFFILFFLLNPNERTLLNILAIVGFLLSALAIVIAYFQILSIKQIALNTQDEIRENIRLTNNILMISDLSSKVKIVDEIQGYLRDDKIDLCILRMKDLKVILNTIKNLNYYSALTNKKEFNAVFGIFNNDLAAFQSYMVNNKKKVNKEVILGNLEGLSTVLQSVEIKLKNQNHDS
jgi:hypothetical protein